ncbi:hypothetical protein PACTADRAFT_80833 [Pachysolen tannophilus NRRL Y-2460]|uniref:Uncharacterized protein n=1 Tax=Pachysolen tannophilus NRRL Y-2460 TaxID=669874 RepID=A0A1E4TUK7_PACTA|nr:hypothetical protein PACTADRAFT_80833 [Pachysolen tannophilus NRRL Y-2460]
MVRLFLKSVVAVLCLSAFVEANFFKFKLNKNNKQKELAVERLCDPEGTGERYTGFRLEKQFILSNNKKNFTSDVHFISCENGNKVKEYPLNSLNYHNESYIPWQREFCPSEETDDVSKVCYKLARRKSFKQKESSIYMKETFVGGLFSTTRQQNFKKNGKILSLNNFEKYFPLEPLLAENVLNQWIELKAQGTIVYHIPLLYTPNINKLKHGDISFGPEGLAEGNNCPQWGKYINENETYQYTKESQMLYGQAARITQRETFNLLSQYKDRMVEFLKRESTPAALKNIFHKDDFVFKISVDDFKSGGAVDNVMIYLSHVVPNTYFGNIVSGFQNVYESISIEEEIFNYDRTEVL